MKKLLLSSVFAFSICAAKAQVTIDTVSLGAGYANQKWYSLQEDEQGSAPKNNWDLAFDASGFGSSIHINSVTGTMLWTYPVADTAGWATLDTTGIGAWPAMYNSETSWSIGALDKGMVQSNSFDLGWGEYNPTNHIVTGDSLFVIKLSTGAYKKLWIEMLAGGIYNFKYADIDGNNLQSVSFPKSAYSGKNFGYYSLQTNTALDREPVPATDWDLLFTQYTTFLPTPYTVAGVLSNNNVTVAQVNGVANVTAYNDWLTQTFVEPINEIGYNWKTFTTSWSIEDSLVYFVKSREEEIWKLVFTGFGGSSNGNYIFSKEKLSAVGIKNAENKQVASLSVYPNPSLSDEENTTIVYNFQNHFSSAVLNIYDMSGKRVASQRLDSSSGLHTETIETTTLQAGMYIVMMNVDGQTVQQKLIVK